MYLYFDVCFKIGILVGLMGGCAEVSGGNVTVCTWGGHFSLGERDEQSICFGILLRVMTSAQMPRCLHGLFHPKHIMTSLGCHMAMSL